MGALWLQLTSEPSLLFFVVAVQSHVVNSLSETVADYSNKVFFFSSIMKGLTVRKQI